MMKSRIRQLLPASVVRMYRRLRLGVESWMNRRKSVEQVFTSIYLERKWGGDAEGGLCSGAGSLDEDAVAPYVGVVRAFLEMEGLSSCRLVDLGCGDFRVGARLAPLAASYVGVDVVRPVVEQNQASHASDRVSFLHRDILRDDLPEGDVCLLRQVLQHLSNDQIRTVLQRVGSRYPFVLITEHYPGQGVSVTPNLDKIHGCDVRVGRRSGVYLDLPPFSLPSERLECLLEAPGAGMGETEDPGVIRTLAYRTEVPLRK
jgi:SAM-dependent methyltransferase